MSSQGVLLSVDLSVSLDRSKQVLQSLQLKISQGEILGLVGSSGSGKSTLSLAILGLLDRRRHALSGFVDFRGTDLTKLAERELRRIRGREISLILQSPSSALNPMLRLGTHLKEAWRVHAESGSGRAEIADALDRVSLPSDPSFLNRRPSQISVGQGQRLLIAMAILHSPLLLIADEPTSALDAITQLEILELFRSINQDNGTSILLISHDLTAVRTVCDRVAVLYEGGIVASGAWDSLARGATHPYVQALTKLAAPLNQGNGNRAAAGRS